MARSVKSSRDSYGDDQEKDRFAGLLAHAHAHAKHVHKAHKPKGTSELDGANASKDDKETTGASDDATNADGATATADAAAAAPAAGTVVRAVGALTPELQAKLARVMDRMQAETGHSVTIEETYRTQSRQDALYAQGRDTDGPVVTWTQNSKHSQGRAVDLLLDGGAAGPDAYATLQRIAKEEGLHTLGARDPGHLELAGSGTADATSLKPAAPADASGPGQVSVARLAQVAQIADVKVARPASVARVATVAQPGASDKALADPTVTSHFAQSNDGSDKSSSDSSSDSGANSQSGHHAGYGSMGSTFTLRNFDNAAGPAPVIGSTAAERTERILAAADNAPARPLSQITMNVDAGNGATDRIQVGLRGNSLSTTIDVSDARAAQTMSARSDELVRALNRDGMEVESMRVRAVASTNAPVAAQPTQDSSGASTNSRFDRGNPWQQQERQQAQSDRRQQREQRRRDAQ
jgi:hypothetical protein